MHHSSLASLLQQINSRQKDDVQRIPWQSEACHLGTPQLRVGNPGGGARGKRKEGNGKPAAVPFIPPATEVELQRHHLIHLAHHLDSLTGSLSEAKAETELLVAERSMVICKLEAANRALLFGKDMDAIDLGASEQAENRVAALREKLPPTSCARRLTERSDLKDAHEVLQQQLLNLHSVWQEQSVRVEQDRALYEHALHSKQAELRECQTQLQERCEDLETLMQEKQMSVAEAEGMRDQLLEAEVHFARLQEESQSDTRCLAHTASELRDQLLALHTELENERSRNQERLLALQKESEHERSRNQERLLAVQTELEHERFRNQEQLLAVRAQMEQQQQMMKEHHTQEVTSLQANQALAHQELQRHIAALELELQGSITRRERAEALQRDAWQQNQDLRKQAEKAADQLVQENAKLMEEKMNLKIVVDEAEKQLQLMHQDLQGVKKHQQMALEERQQQSEELAKSPQELADRGVSKDPVRQSLPHPQSLPRPKKKPPQRGKPWILV